MLPVILYWQTALIAVFVFLLIIYVTRCSLRSNIDGPIGVPIFGYLPFLSSKPHEKFLSLSKKYGNIFSIKLGSIELVVLNDWSSIKEAFSKDEFTGRPETMFFNVFFPNQNLGSLEGKVWKEQRRFALKTLRDLGFGKVKMEQHICDEINYLIEEIDKQCGKPTKLKKLIGGSILNIVAAFVAGRRFNRNDNEFHQILDALLPEHNDTVTLVGISVLFPGFARFLANFKLFRFHKVRQVFNTLQEYVHKEVANHKKTHEKEFVNDYIDAFLNEMTQLNSKEASGFIDDILIGNTMGFFGAGIQTVTDTLSWTLLLLCYFSEYQKKIQEEMDSVIGDSRVPVYSDRNQMLLLQAFTLEVQRWMSLVPLNLPRKTLSDTVLQGKRIPKGTQILANFHAVNIDDTLWQNPQEFNPHRFISEDGKSIIKHDALLTFSYGKRSCPGEALANAEIFLFTSFLLQKYNISNADGGKPSLESVNGAALSPKTLNLCFTRRSN